MDTAAWIAIIVAVLGSGWIGAVLGSWLTARQSFNEDLRTTRLDVYPVLWARTSTLSRSPRTLAGPEDLRKLQQDLREWYYADGGLLLSRSSAQRYIELQEAMDAALVNLYQREPEPGPLPDELYLRLTEATSALRTGLTEDLESRARRTVLSAITLGMRHRRQRRASRQRLPRLRAPFPPTLPLYPYDLRVSARPLKSRMTEVAQSAEVDATDEAAR